jgi:hypothetical protein
MAGVDFIWDNPPYTAADTKEAVLRALVETGARSATHTMHTRMHAHCHPAFPPLTTPARVPARLALRCSARAGKPFCMLLPSSVVYAKLFRDLLDPEKARFCACKCMPMHTHALRCA